MCVTVSTLVCCCQSQPLSLLAQARATHGDVVARLDSLGGRLNAADEASVILICSTRSQGRSQGVCFSTASCGSGVVSPSLRKHCCCRSPTPPGCVSG